MTAEHSWGLQDRSSERNALQRLLHDARNDRSAVLVIRGEAGVGKSALLRYAAERASGFRVARIAGVESEMELPFAALHQLCAPMLAQLDALPQPQQRALRIALGLASGDPPDRFLVALGALTLLAEVAEKQPLFCIVEDTQWLDRASRQVLGFVARRLLAEPVAIVFAVREPSADGELVGLPDLALGGLGEDDARALLATVIPGRLDERVRDRIVAETRGNPLALLELPRGLSAAQLVGGFGLPERLPLTGRIEESFLRRLDRLPHHTRLLLLVAAAEPIGDPALMWRAATMLGVPATALDPATQTGLLEVGAQVRFRHPLVRSAIYRSASERDRESVHRALADATDAALEPDRRAWHAAQAARGPDDDVASELEQSAGRAQARGGLAAAAAFLGRAADLTTDANRRAERQLTAAQVHLQAGAFDAAAGLVAAVEAGAVDEFQRARIDLLRAQLAFVSSRGTEAIPLLLAAAQRLEPLDISLARETYVDAFSATLFGARLSGSVGVSEVAQAARGAPRRSDDAPAIADLLLDALVALSDDYDTAVPLFRDALQRLSGEEISAKERLRWLWLGCVVALETWDDESAHFLSHQGVQIARETGTLSELALAVTARAPVLVFAGELSAAASTVAEAQSVEEATGISSAPYGALILQAWQGNPRETRELIELTLREATSRGEGIGVAISEYARAVLCNGLGQYEEALAAACCASEHQEVVAENWGLSELVEPATRTGRTDLATDALNRLARKARAARTEWALGVEARSRALLSKRGRAEGCFRQAIDHLGRTRVRAELARTHLLYGEWLRRENRRVDAREQLREAHEAFVAMGAEAFADRARHELLATGEKVRSRRADTRDVLTHQEEQIARLARDGLTNPEIGAQLFISPRTVEWHLRKVFAKLEISSRKGLGSALPDRQATPA